MVSVSEKRLMVKLARMGKLEGDDGLRTKINELVKVGFQGEDLDFSEKPYFRSALWEATWKNNEAIVRLLAEKGAAIAFKDYQDRTPLHEAAYYGHMSLVQFFLEKGHPLDCLDKSGHTPLFRAVEAGRSEVVQYLIERKAETNLLDTDSVTPQHVASFSGMPHLSDWLLYKGAWKNRFAVEDGGPVLAEDPPGSARGENEDAPAGDGEGDAAAAAGGATSKKAEGRPKFTD